MAGLFEERRGRIEIFVRIAHGGGQTAQKFERAGRVARRKANLREPQEVGGHELMIFDFAGEDKFDQFAGRLFVTSIEKLARRRPKNFRRRSGGRVGTIAGDLRVESSQLSGSLQFEGNERSCASALGFDGESGKIISGLGELLGLNEVFYPLDLPRAQILQCAFFLEPFNAGESILLVLQDALVNRCPLRKRNPRSIRNVGQDLCRVRSGRSQIKQPRGGRRGIAPGKISTAKRSIRTVVSIAPEICPKKRVEISLQGSEEAARLQMLANVGKVRPKTLRHTRSIDLVCKRRQREFPLSKGFGAGTLLVVGEGQAVQHFGTARGELESVSVIAYRGASIAALGVVVSESQIAGRRGGTLLEKGREIILGSALFRDAEIFAVARTIVEPNVAGKLSVAVDWLA